MRSRSCEWWPHPSSSGLEVLLFVVSVALWLAWMVWQFRNEGATIEKESQQLTSSVLRQILDRDQGA